MAEERISDLAQRVQSNAKYKSIMPEIVQRLVEDALRRELSGKQAVKDVRSKLHQIGGAYFKKKPDFHFWQSKLNGLPSDPAHPAVRDFCKEAMHTHASTAERIPILDTFFHTCLEPIAPVSSVLDLACGLNPLAVPWMPLAEACSYHSCDIYLDMLQLVAGFLKHLEMDGSIEPCDLVSGQSGPKAQIAFLLKSIPCLEQVDKAVALPLLRRIPCKHILVSFPVHSLGGHRKGMPGFYRDHFFEIVAGEGWQIEEFTFSFELAFLVTK